MGLDGHDRGAKIVAKHLRDSGMDVVYTGLRQTPENIVNTAVQEDVHCIGLSILSGAHLTICRKVFSSFKEKDITAPPVVFGGVIPAEDTDKLKEMGAADVFSQGTPLAEISDRIRKIVSRRDLDIS